MARMDESRTGDRGKSLAVVAPEPVSKCCVLVRNHFNNCLGRWGEKILQ
jgi:hypothetical protein